MYLSVEDRKRANPYVDHVMSAEWDQYYYEKESSSAVQTKEKDVEKVGTASEEGTHIKSTVDIASKITKDNAKTIQDEKNVLIEVSTAATDRGLEFVIDIEKEYGVSETMGDGPSKP